MMKKHVIVLLLIASFTTRCQTTESSKYQIVLPGPVQDLGWEFELEPAWSDEFNYEGLPNPAKWDYDLGGHGWGNNELQCYTNRIENAVVSEGTLKIIARKETFEGKEFTSARLVSRNKGDFLYGRIEVSAKLPSGRGTWPAIWMLPTDWEYGGWPKSGEIDIMEHVGHNPDVVHISTHTEAYYWVLGNNKTAAMTVPNARTDFNTYRIDWTPYAVKGFINGQHIFTHINEGTGYQVWPFDKRFHLLLNIAVGGNWGGQQGVDPSIFPATMEIDWVRYYRMIPKNQ